jgi:hypothetical protein
MKKNPRRKSSPVKKTIVEKSPRESDIEKVLVENFIALQKVMTNMATKFDNLSDNIAKLLEVFEISAKALAEKDFEQLKDSDNKEVLEKLNNLLEQNKIIARGITLMGEKNIQPSQPSNIPENLPQRRMPQPNPGLQGYQQSRRF